MSTAAPAPSPPTTRIEFARNGERYAFLRWGQTAFRNFTVVPPNTGIVHQVNLEYLGRVIFDAETDGSTQRLSRHPGRHRLAHHHDQRPGRARLGRRRHRGRSGHARPAGDHAHSAGHRLPPERASCRPGATATDLVLTVTEMLRKKGVVDKFVEFFGDGLANLPLADRATIANMAPEYGSTCGIFPIDEETIRYLELSGRPRERSTWSSAYAKAPGHVAQQRRRSRPTTPTCSSSISARSSRASPARAARRTACRCRTPRASTQTNAQEDRPTSAPRRIPSANGHRRRRRSTAQTFELQGRRGADRRHHQLHQHLQPVRACWAPACSPARRAQRGLKSKPWVKTSLAPGSRVVTDYFTKAGVLDDLAARRLRRRRLRLHHLHRQLRPAEAGDLRRREGRRHHRLLGALRQSQLRRPRAPGSAA